MTSRMSCVLALLLATAVLAGCNENAIIPSKAAKQVTITFDETTNLAATVSPAGDELIIEAQGVLWRLPRNGGEALQVTEFTLEPARPQWSPRGDVVAFQAYKGGTWDIWTMAPDGTDLKQLTDGPYDERYPEWSPDGSRIAFGSDRPGADEREPGVVGSYDIWSIDVDTGELQQWTATPDLEESYPTWSPNGNEIAFVANNSIQAVDANGNRHTLVGKPDQGSITGISWSPDGGAISYVLVGSGRSDLMVATLQDGAPAAGEAVTEGEDVFPFDAKWLADNVVLYTADGKIRIRDLSADQATDIPYTVKLVVDRPQFERKGFAFDSRAPQPVKGIVTPALSPDGESIAFVALNDLWLMKIGDKPEKLTDDAYWEADPAWSHDGSRLAYVSDRAGTPDIYIRDMTTGNERRLTKIDGAELYPAWSPDGSRIAFLDQIDTDAAVHVVQVDSGAVNQVTEPLYQPGRPTWSADGQTLALTVVVAYNKSYREGTNQILLVNTVTGDTTYEWVASNESITTRTTNGPVWSPSGHQMAFVNGGWLWVVAVKPNGQIDGEPRRITDELASSPSWNGASNKLLYLNNGELKMVSVDGGSPQTIPVPLTWQRAQPEGRTVIHAGRLWDGVSPAVQTDVDITVVGNRIAKIEPHRDSAHQGSGIQVIDASGLTVAPGLFEMHTHQFWAVHDYGYGGRLGRLSLAYGITSTRSVGDDAYRAVAGREALRSGARVGPRYFATGGPLDGTRVYYNVMRSITSQEQFELELQRAWALDYDILKTYVRLKPSWMQQAAEAAHALGVPAVSHFLSPGVLVGQDGTTHFGATERLDYSRITSETSVAYDDVIKLFADTGMGVVTTYFAPEPSMFAPATDIAHDPRLQTLMPSWEQASVIQTQQQVASGNLPAWMQGRAAMTEDMMRIVDSGGVVLAGTDSPLTSPAIQLHSELRFLENNGFTPYQALQTATSVAAQALGVEDDLGTIEAGKLADMIFVDGYPAEDIEQIIHVQKVMKNGVLHTVEQLMAPYAN